MKEKLVMPKVSVGTRPEYDMKKIIIVLLLIFSSVLGACNVKTASENTSETSVNDVDVSSGAIDVEEELPVPEHEEEPAPEYTKYMMVYFTGGQESIYSAVSEDGYTWNGLNRKGM